MACEYNYLKPIRDTSGDRGLYVELKQWELLMISILNYFNYAIIHVPTFLLSLQASLGVFLAHLKKEEEN